MSKTHDYIQSILSMQTDECIAYPFAKGTKGYGLGSYKAKRWHAHRFVCAAVHGEAKPGQMALHSCGNAWCVNHRHLRWGSGSENAADRALMGKTARGSFNGWAKLTEDDVRAIKARRRSGMTGVEAGRPFGASKYTVSLIMKGKQWAHVS